MTQTIAITCPATIYTALSTGEASVTIKPRGPAAGKLVVTQSLPPPDTINYMKVSEGDYPIGLGNLDVLDIVYFRPDKAMTMEVLRG